MTTPDSTARSDSAFGGHTPGPWHVVPYGDGDSLVICSDQGGEWRICFMATHGGTASVWEAIQANARLVAAAPELAARLERALAIIDEIDEDQKRPESGGWGVECACCMGELLDEYRHDVAAMRETLAKATPQNHLQHKG